MRILSLALSVFCVLFSCFPIYASTIKSVVLHNDVISVKYTMHSESTIKHLEEQHGHRSKTPFNVRLFDDMADYDDFQEHPNERKVYVGGRNVAAHLAAEVALYYFEETINRHDVDAMWLERGMAADFLFDEGFGNVYKNSFCRRESSGILDIIRSEEDYIGMWALSHHLSRKQPDLLTQIIHSVHVGEPAHPYWIEANVSKKWASDLCKS